MYAHRGIQTYGVCPNIKGAFLHALLSHEVGFATRLNLKSLVTSLAFQQLREADAVNKQEHVSVIHACTCKIQWYTICMLIISILGIVIFIILNARKFKTI